MNFHTKKSRGFAALKDLLEHRIGSASEGSKEENVLRPPIKLQISEVCSMSMVKMRGSRTVEI